MKKNKEEIWYCTNSKGHKIPPYETNYHLPKPKRGLERLLDVFGIILGISLVIAVIMAVFFC
jgi:hypothetical protein